MTVTGPGSVRLVSGRRIVVIAAIAGTILSIVAGLTSRTLWLALGGAQPLPARLYGAAVWPDHTRRPPALGLPDQNGQVFSLPAQAGEAVVVTFMDPAGTSCQGEARDNATVRAGRPAAAPVELVVVSTGLATDTPVSAHAFAAQAGWDGRWDWHWLFASPRRLAEVWRAYGASASSAAGRMYLVGRDGYERAALRVPVSQQELVTDLRRLTGS